MEKKTTKEPKKSWRECEFCREKQSIYFAQTTYPQKSYRAWKFLCGDCVDDGMYLVDIGDFFFDKEETLDWLVHLNGKPFMDWWSFMRMIERYKYGQEQV